MQLFRTCTYTYVCIYIDYAGNPYKSPPCLLTATLPTGILTVFDLSPVLFSVDVNHTLVPVGVLCWHLEGLIRRAAVGAH